MRILGSREGMARVVGGGGGSATVTMTEEDLGFDRWPPIR